MANAQTSRVRAPPPWAPCSRPRPDWWPSVRRFDLGLCSIEAAAAAHTRINTRPERKAVEVCNSLSGPVTAQREPVDPVPAHRLAVEGRRDRPFDEDVIVAGRPPYGSQADVRSNRREAPDVVDDLAAADGLGHIRMQKPAVFGPKIRERLRLRGAPNLGEALDEFGGIRHFCLA